MPFFSIVIPAYNRVSMLVSCIESVQKQTFTDWELIVVDDGSKDNTREVVSKINDTRIRYIYQDNKERSAARNTGARNADGEYICFLDSDDQFKEEHLQILFKQIEEKQFPEAMFFTNHLLVENGKQIVNQIPALGNTDPIIYFLNNPVIPARTCTHHNILKKYPFREDIVIVEDTVLWATISVHYPVYHLQVETILYHLHDDNSVNLNNNFYLPRLLGLKKLFQQDDMKGRIPRQLQLKLVSDAYYGIGRYHDLKGIFWEMLKNLFISFYYYPIHKHNKAKLFMVYKYLRARRGIGV